MFEYIFTIGCFDKLHKGHIKLLENMKKQTGKIVIGLHDNNSIEKLKNTSDIDIDSYDTFIIDDVDPTKSIQEYISNQDLLSI
jgi:cytidyltransferase-like protein